MLSDPFQYVQDASLQPSAEDIERNASFQGGEIQISSCFYGSAPVSDRDDIYIFDYQNLIWHVGLTKALLERAGYPAGVVADALDPARDEYIRQIQRAYRQGDDHPSTELLPPSVYELDVAALAVLNQYRDSSGSGLPGVYGHSPGGFCGGDYYGDNRITLDPDNGRVWLMTELNFDWCTSRGRAPYSDSGCDLWVQIAEDATIPDGTYRYQAVWDDGTVDTGREQAIQLEGEISFKVRKPTR